MGTIDPAAAACERVENGLAFYLGQARTRRAVHAPSRRRVEPVGIDVQGVAGCYNHGAFDEVFQFIRQLAISGRSLLLVEQYITKALAVADYVYLLNRGRVSFAGCWTPSSATASS